MSVSDATNMNTLQIEAPKRTNTNKSTTPTTWPYTTVDEWQSLMGKGIKTPAIQYNKIGAPNHTKTNNSEARATHYTWDEWQSLRGKEIKTPAIQHNKIGAPKHTKPNKSEVRETYYT
ncbi:hypothetical protein N0V85_002651 [Neurospora sp. IMI 360204]|nr:hypothetical protein N0V85_002651 [Neurospora sp. IMI 360204]